MRERSHYLDILKGIGIVFVVFGHVTHIGWLRTYIWGFHMPLFFFVSGVLFERERYGNFISFVKRRFKSLVIPYFLFSLIGLIWWSVSFIDTNPLRKKVRGLNSCWVFFMAT